MSDDKRTSASIWPKKSAVMVRRDVTPCKTCTFFPYHTVKYEGLVPPKIGGVRNQICATQDPKVDCVRQVDFDERVVLHCAMSRI